MFVYLQLDAKKSPLALLAQTCSSIGKDTNPSKPIIPPIDKKDGKDKDARKTPDSPKSNHGEERSKSRPSSAADHQKKDRASPRSNSERSESPKSGFPVNNEFGFSSYCTHTCHKHSFLLYVQNIRFF